MKKFILQLVLTLLIALALEQFLPWWPVVLAGACGGLLVRSNYSFLCGFLSIALLWLVAAYYIDMQAVQPLSEQIAQLLRMKSKWMLFAITATIGGIAGGLGAWCGYCIGNAFSKR
jgi:zinc transporter ZupT